MKVREHRGGLDASMMTVAEIQPTFAALATFFSERHNTRYLVEQIAVRAYGYDKRINWDTHLVTVDGQAVGFTDQMPSIVWEESTPVDPTMASEEISARHDKVMESAKGNTVMMKIDKLRLSNEKGNDMSNANESQSSGEIVPAFAALFHMNIDDKFKAAHKHNEYAAALGALWEPEIIGSHFQERLKKLYMVTHGETIELNSEEEIRDGLSVAYAINYQDVQSLTDAAHAQFSTQISHDASQYKSYFEWFITAVVQLFLKLKYENTVGEDFEIQIAHLWIPNTIESGSSCYYSSLVMTRKFKNVIEYFTIMFEETNSHHEFSDDWQPYDDNYRATIENVLKTGSEDSDFEDSGYYLVPRDLNLTLVVNHAPIIHAMKDFLEV